MDDDEDYGYDSEFLRTMMQIAPPMKNILLALSIISTSKQFQEMKNLRLLKAGDDIKTITRAKSYVSFQLPGLLPELNIQNIAMKESKSMI